MNGDKAARAAVQQPSRPRPAADYFDKTGLLAATLAEDVRALGPVAAGVDNVVWTYGGGVWSPNKTAVRGRVAHLLGERYRRSFATSVEDIVMATAPRITCDPVPQYVNFTNGLYDWQSDTLLPHDHNELSTAQLTVAYNPSAACPNFEKFLSEVVPVDVVDDVWESVGYLM